MIFSKDYKDDQLPYTFSDKFNMIKVFLSAIFCTISVFLWLIGKDTILGVLIVVFGAIWNIFMPLNKPYSFVLSIIVGILYGLACFSMGLVANAFLYLAYYVPMQYLACNNDGDSFVLKNKKLSYREAIFVFFYYIIFFVGVYIFSRSVENSKLCLLDSVSATLLALSALVRNLRTSEYYKFRFIALVVSIFMWSLICSGTIIYSGAKSILIMYLMYFSYEIVSCIYEKKNYKSKKTEDEKQRLMLAKQKLAEQKKAKLKAAK